MGRVGVEPDTTPVNLTACKNSNLEKSASDGKTDSAAKSGAVQTDITNFEPDLTTVINAWPNLPEHIRAAVMALVRTGGGHAK